MQDITIQNYYKCPTKCSNNIFIIILALSSESITRFNSKRAFHVDIYMDLTELALSNENGRNRTETEQEVQITLHLNSKLIGNKLTANTTNELGNPST